MEFIGGGWEAEGGLYHPQGHTQQQCVLSRAQKQPQSTWYHVALLVPLSGSIDPVVYCHGFTGSAVKVDLAIYWCI